MKFNSILICLLLAISVNFFTIAKAQVNVNDSLALVDLYNSTNGDNWRFNENWLTQNPVSTWYGITVENKRVIVIKLVGNKLKGNIPYSISNLVKLHSINLSYNGLTGSIPLSIGYLSKLSDLELNNNHLSGSIPFSIGNLTSLDTLFLLNNRLSGSIPFSIGNLVNLTFLFLDNNQINGSIPFSIGNLKKLYALSFYNNKLSGIIPSTIGNLTSLNYLTLSYNKLSGAIPSTIGNLISAKTIAIGSNQLTGSIPSSLGNLTNLNALVLFDNHLTGEIPTSFANLKHLDFISLSFNELGQSNNFNLPFDKGIVLTVYINYNKFTFDGLEFLARNIFENYLHFYPQASIPIHKNGNILSVYAGGTLSNNTYKWFKAGEKSSIIIQGDSTFHPTQSGKYYAYVTNSIVTQLTLISDTISSTMPLAQTQNSIENVAAVKTLNNHFSIYPNPAKDIVHIQTNGNAMIIVSNSAGKLVLTKTIKNSGEINVSSYANGIYYIQNKNTGETQKVIVVH